jgi:tRNA dimethylallyltransferase
MADDPGPAAGERHRADSDTLAILGATGSGKTAVAVAVAQRLGGEVISMDSRQVYRGMDIGTAKPTADERGGVRHHGFDLVDPGERFNAGRFAELARRQIREITARGRVPILAGGTGFFLRALTHPMFEEPPLDDRRKEQWKRYLADLDLAELGRWAVGLDPATDVRRSDRQRLARVVETAVLTGRPLTWWQRNAPSRTAPIDPVIVVLDFPRGTLVRRIEDRVDDMVRRGLVAEVQLLLDQGYDERAPGLNTTGYVELVPHLRGECGLDEAVERIKTATRRYARRQLTWLRNQLPPDAVWLDGTQPPAQLADLIVRVWMEAKP